MQSLMRILIGILTFALAILLVLFGVQNTQTVSIQFLSYVFGPLSLSLVIIGAAIIGAALMWLISLWGWFQRSIRAMREHKQRTQLETRNRDLEKRVTELERELNGLRGPAPPVGTAQGQAKASK